MFQSRNNWTVRVSLMKKIMIKIMFWWLHLKHRYLSVSYKHWYWKHLCYLRIIVSNLNNISMFFNFQCTIPGIQSGIIINLGYLSATSNVHDRLMSERFWSHNLWFLLVLVLCCLDVILFDRFTHLKENTLSLSLLKENGSQIKDITAIESQEFGRNCTASSEY